MSKKMLRPIFNFCTDVLTFNMNLILNIGKAKSSKK